MRNTMAMLAGLIAVAGCVSAYSNLHVESRPEGLAVDVQGYRFLLRNVHTLDIGVRNAGEGVLYRLNEHEILLLTGRGLVVDGRRVALIPGELHEILPGGGLRKVDSATTTRPPAR